LAVMEEKKAKTDMTEEGSVTQSFPARKREIKEEEDAGDNDGIDGKEGEVCLEKLISPEEMAKEREENLSLQEVKVVCDETTGGQGCHDILEEKKENIICY